MKRIIGLFVFLFISFYINAQTIKNDESKIIIQIQLIPDGTTPYLNLFINSERVARNDKGFVYDKIVKNGSVTVLLQVEGSNPGSKSIVINPNHETVVIEALARGNYTRGGTVDYLRIAQTTPLPVNQAEGIEQAVNKSAEQIIKNIPQNSIAAIINISSRDADLAEYIIDEIAYLLVNSKKCRIVERKTIDAIRVEQNFQMSGDVDDDNVISIGKMIGASVVITGTVSGSGYIRRLRIKALDVKTGEILAMSSEPF